jgi:hypothetical protein
VKVQVAALKVTHLVTVGNREEVKGTDKMAHLVVEAISKTIPAIMAIAALAQQEPVSVKSTYIHQ